MDQMSNEPKKKFKLKVKHVKKALITVMYLMIVAAMVLSTALYGIF